MYGTIIFVLVSYDCGYNVVIYLKLNLMMGMGNLPILVNLRVKQSFAQQEKIASKPEQIYKFSTKI